jgi:diadenosine tetraphosphate (Ap4A) HIT family hydrolase
MLFTSDQLYAVPDKFPLLPGHVLVITRRHARCLAELDPEGERELDAAAERVRAFLERAYGAPVLAWENGVAGQTVFHAHLHLIPVAADEFPHAMDAHPEVAPVEHWEPVRAHFAAHGGYHYLEFNGQRRLIHGRSPAVRALQEWLTRHTGLQRVNHDWRKTTSPADVEELLRRWRGWAEGP